jgi:hypothetical protein
VRFRLIAIIGFDKLRASGMMSGGNGGARITLRIPS